MNIEIFPPLGSVEEIVKKVTEADYKGYHPTRAMWYMRDKKARDVLHKMNEKYAIYRDNYVLYPYMFDFMVHGKYMLPSGWFSGMGQGFALRAYIDDRLMADKILNSFETSYINKDYHYMEYPGVCDAINGHIFAMWGIYEYCMRYGGSKSEYLLQKGAQWVKNNFHNRNPGGASYYCNCHKEIYEQYHSVHIIQLQWLYEITRDQWFTKQVALLRSDYHPTNK